VFDPTRHPPRAGVLLVLSCAALIGATVWLLPATGSDRLSAYAVAVAMAVAAIGFHVIVGKGGDQRLLVGYPLIVFAGTAALGGVAASIAPSYAGLLTIAFIYIGLCTLPGTTPVMIPPAMGAWLLSNGVLDHAELRTLEVRLPVAICIWACAGGLLSQHAQRAIRAEELLRREAMRDPMTGLHNRRALDDLLAHAQDGDSIVMLDLDHFKSINDEHGHDTGDRLLTDFARTLLRSLRGTDIAMRYGGDEFLLYLPKTPIERVDIVLRRIHRSWHSAGPLTTFSAGVARIEGGREARASVADADQMLYQAKRGGRNQWAQTPEAVPTPRVRQTDLAPARR
jgi:diguanylate cyclase (GGDEF)-like protein